MHPFADFDFSLPPDNTTPLDELLQRQLKLVQSTVDQGRFIPIPAQTGLGKTHAACALILERLVQEAAGMVQGKPDAKFGLTYYVTNSVDNVTSTRLSLLSLIERQQAAGQPRFSPAQQAWLSERIIHLFNQGEQLLQGWDNLNIILDAFELSSARSLQDSLDTLHSLKQAAEHTQGLKAAMHESASRFFSNLTGHIREKLRDGVAVQYSASLQNAIDNLYPGEKLIQGRASVVFLTTSKLLHGYHTLEARIDPLRKLDGDLLIIDEIDRQNGEILKVLCQAPALDLVEFTKTLSASLGHNQLENGPRYQGVDPLVNPLRERVSQFARDWALQYHFRSEGASLDDRPVRLFSDRTLTHVHSAEHHLRLRSDEDRQKNIIHATDKLTPQTTASGKYFSRFVNEADWLFRFFLQTFRQAAWIVTRNDAEDLQAGERQYMQAVSALLTHYGLGQYRSAVLDLTRARTTGKGQRKRSRVAQRSYHDSGLKVTDILRNRDASDTIACLFKGLEISPSGLLAAMVDAGVTVLGISATANAATVVHNFDLDYLRTRLGERYVTLSREQQLLIGEYYNRRRQYQNRGIEIRCTPLMPQLNKVRALLEKQLGQPVRDLQATLADLMGTVPSTRTDFLQKWAANLIQAMEHFVEQPDNRYMVAMLNRNTSAGWSLWPLLEHHLQNLCGKPVRIFAGLNAAMMRQGRFDDILENLAATADDKVIVLSAYASMGEGKNPDYAPLQSQDTDNLVWVGDGTPEGPVRADIDSLYLEKPTNLLASDDDRQTALVMLLHQMLSLQTVGEISPTQTRSLVRRILLDADNKLILGEYYKTMDAQHAYRRILEQAVGRMARTAYKRRTILLLFDSQLLPILAADNRAPEPLPHEYRALRDYCRETFTGTPASVPDDHSRQLNLAHIHSDDTLALIGELLRGIFSGREDAITDWQSLRLQLLRFPCIAENSPECPRIYLRPPELPYAFEGSLDIPFDGEGLPRAHLKLFNEVSRPVLVSEEDCQLPRLMSNPVIRQHFKQQRFATQWPPLPWVMTPAAYQNIYKGALGEESVKAILTEQGCLIEELPIPAYERFDFIVVNPRGLRIAVDAKHWSSSGEAERHAERVAAVKQYCSIHHFAYINTLGDTRRQIDYLDDELKRCPGSQYSTLVLPGIVNRENGQTLHQNLAPLLSWQGDQHD